MRSPLTEQNLVRVEVITNDEESTFITNMFCSLEHCGKGLTIESNGPKTTQNLSCEDHGVLVSFQHQTALGDFVRFKANSLLAADGHELIEAEAFSVFGNAEPSVDSN